MEIEQMAWLLVRSKVERWSEFKKDALEKTPQVSREIQENFLETVHGKDLDPDSLHTN